MKNKTTMPEIIINATKKRIENNVIDLALFLAPIYSPDIESDINELLDLHDTATTLQNNEWEKLFEIDKKVKKMKLFEWYQEKVEKSTLCDEQKLLLLNLWVTLSNAKYYQMDTYMEENESNEKHEYATKLVAALNTCLVCFAEKMPSKENASILTKDIMNINRFLLCQREKN